MSDPVLGVVVAGGLARRMGGGDKTVRLLGGRTILARAIERLRPQCRALIVNANGDPARFALYGLPVVPDPVPDYPGPLAGILAAVDHAAEQRPDIRHVVTVAGDTPFLPLDLVARLVAARDGGRTVLACAASGGRIHPVFGLWPIEIRDELRRALVLENERKVGRFAARYGLAVVEWPCEPLDPFFNVNSTDDLGQAELLLTRAQT